MCRNWKLWAVVGAVVVGVAILVPGVSWGAVLPLLLVAACPLMMVLMGVGIFSGGRLLGSADVDEADRDREVVR
jgi:hypothetical protein